jgi:hypothetical protein
VFVLVILLFAALAAHSQAEMIARHGRLPAYLSTMAWEWLLSAFVLWGTRRRQVSLRQLTGGRWSSPEDVLLDIGIAVAFWITAGAVLAALSWAFGLASPEQVAEAKKQIGVLLPVTRLEVAVWIPLSATAGFCEELMFRGYLQKQFTTATRSTVLGIVLQAAVFGIAHAYQGALRTVVIGVYGALFGILAVLRKSIRPGMIGHFLQDSIGGLVYRLIR